MQIVQDRTHRGDSFRRRAEWILVGSDLNDVLDRQVVLPGDFLDRPAGLINRQIRERRVERRQNGIHWIALRIFFTSTFSAIRSRMRAIFSTSVGRVLTITSCTFEAT